MKKNRRIVNIVLLLLVSQVIKHNAMITSNAKQYIFEVGLYGN
ncbi:hypothetical protein [Staphylococcus ureilyticus]|nr:hypothetical protein [Staphylococcus ureilyticus]MDU0462008.1 hypothetical protein [Staphylococcus ureilyticus]